MILRYKLSNEWLDYINAQIHDLWLNVNDIRFDANTHRLIVPLSKKPDQPPEKSLVISESTHLTILDTENIGWYDVHSITIAEPEGRLHLKGNIPLDIFIDTGLTSTVTLLPTSEIV